MGFGRMARFQQRGRDKARDQGKEPRNGVPALVADHDIGAGLWRFFGSAFGLPVCCGRFSELDHSSGHLAALSLALCFIGFNDPTDERMAHDVGAREGYMLDAFDALKHNKRVGKAGRLARRQVDL